MNEDVTVTGLDELARTLLAMPPKIAASALRPALNAGAQVVEAAMESTVPRGATGALAGSISRKIHVTNNLLDASAIVGPAYVGGYKHTSADPGVRAKFLEFGTRKMSPRPFIRAAWESSKGPATDAMIAVLKAIVGAITK